MRVAARSRQIYKLASRELTVHKNKKKTFQKMIKITIKLKM